jgi:hypothetical protein
MILTPGSKDKNTKVFVTNRNRKLFFFFCVAIIVYLLYDLLFNEQERIDASLILLFVFLLLGIYFISFIDVLLFEGSRVILHTVFAKQIKYKRVTKVSLLPVISRFGSHTNSIYVITYIDENEKEKKRLICISGARSELFERVKKILGL